MISRTHSRRRSVVLSAALVVVLSIFAAACGGGRSDSSEGTATTKVTSATAFGTLDSPCGAGGAKGATQQGVTDTTITVGYGDDAGYTGAPGLNKEMSEAMRAMIKWCNDQGGINGRQVVGKYYDAAILNVSNAMTESCGQVFMLVGQGWSLDSAQETIRVGCKMASVPTYTVSPQFANGPLMVQPAPNPADYYGAANAFMFADKYPAAVKKAATMYANYAATQDSTEKAVIAYKQAGWTFLSCDQVYNIGGESNWSPFLQRLKDCGAEIVYFSGSPNPNFQNVLDAAKAIGYNPMWMTEANMYDSNFAKWNNSGNGDNVYVRLSYYPFDQADKIPAVAKYLEIMKANNATTGLLSAQASAAFLLWAQGAKACGANLTSDCVIGELKKVTKFDAGGLLSPTNPGANIPGDCGLVVKLTGTAFTQVLPTTIGTQSCDPKYLIKLAGPVVDRAKLDANRISQAGK